MPYPQMDVKYVKGSETSRVSSRMVLTRKATCMVQCGLFFKLAPNFKKPTNTHQGCLPSTTQNNPSSPRTSLCPGPVLGIHAISIFTSGKQHQQGKFFSHYYLAKYITLRWSALPGIFPCACNIYIYVYNSHQCRGNC